MNIFRRRTQGLVAAALASFVISTPESRAADGDLASHCGAGTVLRQMDLDVRDRDLASLPVDLPVERPLLIVATERGIDVTLEVRVRRDAQPRQADSPFRRAGPQYLLVEEPGDARVDVGARGNEPGRARVHVSVQSLKTSAPACLDALRALSKGDEFYARAQALSLGDVAAADDELPRVQRQALASYRAAAAALQPSDELKAHTLMSVAGVLLYGTQDWTAAMEASREAEKAFAAKHREYGRLRARGMSAVALTNIALGGSRETKTREVSAGQFEQARATLREVASAHSARGEVFDQALLINSLGLSYYFEDSFEQALPEYRRARALYQSIDEHMREAQSLQNIALVQLDLALYRDARENFGKALALLDPHLSPKLFGDILNNHALTEARTGNTDAALRLYSQALEILERIHSKREQARSLHGLGNVYRAIGNRQQALEYHQRAFELRSRVADFVGYQFSLNAVADGLRDNGQLQEAIQLRREAAADMMTGVQRGRLLMNLASDRLQAGDRAGANVALSEVLGGMAQGDRVLIGRARALRARMRLANGDLPAARADLDAALEIFRHYLLTSDEFQALLSSARIHCAAGKSSQAGREIDAALALAESLRKTSNNPFLRAASWESTHPAFDLGITRILSPSTCGGAPADSRERALSSLEIVELSRGRTLGEMRAIAAGAARGKLDPDLDRRRGEIFEALADRRQRLDAAIEGGRQDSARSAALRAEVTRLLRELDILDGANGVVAAAPEPARLLRERIEMIPAHTAVVEYWLGESNAYAWVIDRSGVQVFELGPTQRINEGARQLADSMQTFTSTSTDTRIARARAVHRLVLAPLAKRLGGVRRLFIVSDGLLHQVAFAALVTNDSPAPPAYLVDAHDIAVSPSAMDAMEQLPPSPLARAAEALILADPVYATTDARLSRREAPAARHNPSIPLLRDAKGRELPRLMGSAREAEVVARFFPAGKSELLTGFAATREALLARDLTRYSVIHLAAHAIADVEAPQLSNVVLSTLDRQGRAITGEVFAGDLLSRRLEADLVVLSGCDTSLGRNFVGEGLLGMRYATHAAGARAVVASLWKVADVVGPEIMSVFYERMARADADPIAALSHAMKEVRKRRDDPALWGVFQISTAARGPTVH